MIILHFDLQPQFKYMNYFIYVLHIFLHTLFLENEAQIDRNNSGTLLSMSKQVSLPKISLILQTMKIGQNSIYALFARSPSNVNNMAYL